MAEDKKNKDNAKLDKDNDSTQPEEEKPADVEAEGTQDDAKADKSGGSGQSSAGIGVATWVILAAIVVFCAGSGFLLGRLFAGSAAPEETETSQIEQPVQVETPKTKTGASSSWYYDLEPVVACLDEPGVTRYVRATITLEVNAQLEQSENEEFFELKKPVMTNWLTIYLAGLTLEDVRGDRNLKHIQAQILDAFNEKLFPDARPQIKYILFKEFAVQ